jgi:hypothetical protein
MHRITTINVQRNTYHKRKYIYINITSIQQEEPFNIYLFKTSKTYNYNYIPKYWLYKIHVTRRT